MFCLAWKGYEAEAIDTDINKKWGCMLLGRGVAMGHSGQNKC